MERVMQAVQPVKTPRASDSTLNAFAFGAIASGVKNHVFGSWLLVYYNQVLGLEPALAGLALALALVVDAITDPLVGIWSDRVRTRWGRRHPFMYASILPFALSFHALLQPPADLSQSGLFVRLLWLTIAVRVAMTFYEIPRAALGPELTKDYDQRTQLVGWSTSYGWFAGAGFAWLILAFLLPETTEYAGSKAYLNPAGYHHMAWIGGLIIFTTCLISTVSLHPSIPNLYVPKPDPHGQLSVQQLRREIVETLSNRSWLVLFAAGLVFALYVGLHSNTDRYYDLYFWQWVPEQVQVFPIVHMAIAISCGLLVYPLTRGRDKKRTAISLFLLAATLGPLPLLLRLLDPLFSVTLFPANGSALLWWILLLHSSFLVALSILGFILVGSMVADIVEESQRTTGRRSEGLLTAGPALAQKTVSAGGVLVVGVLLSGFGFSGANPTVEAMQEPMRNLAAFHVALDLTLPWISIYLVSKYTITRSSHAQDLKNLGYAESGNAQSTQSTTRTLSEKSQLG
jgi:GPH family glycoside/pentoside/hexuronide:cation symporter